MSNQDFMSNEDLVDDFFDSLNISDNAAAHINALSISESAAPDAPMTGSDEMAWAASSKSSSQRFASSSTSPFFNSCGSSFSSPATNTSSDLCTPRHRQISSSNPSSVEVSSFSDSCRGFKRKSPDNAFTLSSRPEKRICCDENSDEEMEIDRCDQGSVDRCIYHREWKIWNRALVAGRDTMDLRATMKSTLESRYIIHFSLRSVSELPTSCSFVKDQVCRVINSPAHAD